MHVWYINLKQGEQAAVFPWFDNYSIYINYLMKWNDWNRKFIMFH